MICAQYFPFNSCCFFICKRFGIKLFSHLHTSKDLHALLPSNTHFRVFTYTRNTKSVFLAKGKIKSDFLFNLQNQKREQPPAQRYGAYAPPNAY